MTNYNEAADLLRGFVERLRPLTLVSDALQEIGNLDEAIRTRKSAHEKAVMEHEVVTKHLDKVGKDIDDLRVKHAVEAAAHRQTSEDIIAKSKRDAEKIKKDAEAKAVGIVQAAAEEAKAASDRHSSTMSEARRQLIALQAELKAVAEARDAALADHARVVKSTEEMREAARRVA